MDTVSRQFRKYLTLYKDTCKPLQQRETSSVLCWVRHMPSFLRGDLLNPDSLHTPIAPFCCPLPLSRQGLFRFWNPYAVKGALEPSTCWEVTNVRHCVLFHAEEWTLSLTHASRQARGQLGTHLALFGASFSLFIYYYCMCVCTCCLSVGTCAMAHKRPTLWSLFFPSTFAWVLGVYPLSHLEGHFLIFLFSTYPVLPMWASCTDAPDQVALNYAAKIYFYPRTLSSEDRKSVV